MAKETMIFFSYASPDRARVMPFYEGLEKQGLTLWMDVKNLLPGQDWDFEIKRALNKSSFVLVFVSRNSFDRRGYLQRELKIAVDKLDEHLIDDIYLIPILLDDAVDLPEQLKRIQTIKASDPKCVDLLLAAIRHQQQSDATSSRMAQSAQDIYWTISRRKEAWDGLPGYEVEADHITITSEKYPNISEVTEYIAGQVAEDLFRYRAQKFIQQPDLYNYGQDRFHRTNTLDLICHEPIVKGKVVSISYLVGFYGAGAAHPNYYFKTYCFVVDPLFLLQDLRQVFQDEDAALANIRNAARTELHFKLCSVKEGDDTAMSDIEWINRGTEGWDDFRNFVFNPTGIVLMFAPYHVAAYAFGTQTAEVSYASIADLIRPEYRSALHIDFDR
jgi:hypothetical protein